MPVRTKVRLRPLKGKGSEVVETSAVANAGYESPVPQILIPARLAKRLGFLPRPPKEARKETFVGAVGTARMHVIPDALEVTVTTSDRGVGPVKAAAVISPKEKEVLLSDRLIEELKIDILRPASGLWRFLDDKTEALRESSLPQEW